ncbi:MAG: hypothetical protein AABW79_02475 [Nanoarchaeota archaeon]
MTIVDSNKGKNYILKKVLQGLRKDKFLYILLLWCIIIDYLFTFIKKDKFIFNSKIYKYFYHPYNHTWVNERAVEIPIIKEYINNVKGNMLEIGNVLKHYHSLEHDVVDKYESGKGIINQDVVDFKIEKKYDLIVSISTMEHVGWDENIRDAGKIPRAIAHLKKHLSKDGKIIFTVPLGYNPFLDKLIEDGNLFDEMYFLKRVLFGKWRQLEFNQCHGANYAKGISANVLAVLVMRNKV